MDVAVARTDRPRIQLLVFPTSSLIACGLKKILVVSGLRGILIGGILRKNRVFVESFIEARGSVRVQGVRSGNFRDTDWGGRPGGVANRFFSNLYI